jgi:hypothetical protein
MSKKKEPQPAGELVKELREQAKNILTKPSLNEAIAILYEADCDEISRKFDAAAARIAQLEAEKAERADYIKLLKDCDDTATECIEQAAEIERLKKLAAEQIREDNILKKMEFKTKH